MSEHPTKRTEWPRLHGFFISPLRRKLTEDEVRQAWRGTLPEQRGGRRV